MRASSEDVGAAGWLAVASVFAVVVVIALPLLLMGGLAVQINDDVALGPATLGVAGMSFFVTAAVLSVPGGRLAEHLGPARSLRIGALLSALSMVGLALVTAAWHILVLQAVAGISISFTQPAASAAVVEHVPEGHRGLAFGLKQSAIPGAGLLAGLAVPALGVTVGWRWAFVAGAVLGAVFAVALPGIQTRAAPPGGPTARERLAGLRSSYRWLLLLAFAAGMGAAAGNALGMFTTSSGVAAGLSITQAGLLLAVGSLSAIVGRIGAGMLAERSERGALPIASTMLVIGAAGFALMAVGHPLAYVLGAMLAFSAGWAWQGAFLFAIVRRWPDAPAAVTGTVQTGNYLGGVGGPVLFGLVSERASFAVGWVTVALLAVAAAVMLDLGRRMVRARSPHPGQTRA